MRRLLALAAFLLVSGAAFAQADLRPDDLVRKVIEEVLAAVKSDQALAAGDKQRALKLAEEKILPHVDFAEATRLAVGRAWQQASPEQRQRLVDEFRRMLVRTYSNAIGAYQGQTLRTLPLRMRPEDTDVTVRNQYVRASGGKPVQVDYPMRKTESGWKIYDIVVEGVSLVLTYRSEFDAVAREGGLDALIRRLAEKNAPARLPG